MLRWIGLGTVLQVAMVVVGHGTEAVARLFGPFGLAISLVVGLLWARSDAESYPDGARGGGLVGGVSALLGITLSWTLGDVDAAILAFGTLASAMAGALGGLAGRRVQPAPGTVR